MDEYAKFLGDWKTDAEGIAREMYVMVKEMPDEAFGVSKDWVAGYKRDLVKSLIDKAVSPYNYYRDRRLETEKEDAVEYLPADKLLGVEEGKKTKLGWGIEGTAIEEAEYFELNYLDGRKAKVPKSSLKERFNDGGKFYTCRLKDIPTNLFPKNDQTNLWALHEYKAR